MNSVSKTAYYCCGARAEDAASSNPLCNDIYAARFLSGEGEKIFAEFKDETRPNRSNVSRHKIIDDMVSRELNLDPGRNILLIGAGFDSRAFRFTGGKWYEFEEPNIVEIKEERLPASSCPNELTRISIEFSGQNLRDSLMNLDCIDPLVIVEGVIMYLSHSQIDQLLTDLMEGRSQYKTKVQYLKRIYT